MSSTNLIAPPSSGVHGWHVLAAACAFFAAVFAVNGVLIYEAVSTHAGLVANEPYRKGLAYNDRIEADERQARLGWFDKLEIGSSGPVVLTLTEADRPISGLRISGTLGRPATDRYDVRLTFSEVSAGRYEAPAPGIPPGSWLATLEVRRPTGAGPTYRLRKRLWITP